MKLIYKLKDMKAKSTNDKFVENDTLIQIRYCKQNKLYKEGLKLTSQHFTYSQRLVFWHLFFLLKLKKNTEFLKIFKLYGNGGCIKLFNLVYLRRVLLKGYLVESLYSNNKNNQIFNYIYANYLFNRGRVQKAKLVLDDLLINKKIFMTDIGCSYLMNILAIQIENILNSSSEEDFTLQYKENIDLYHAQKTKYLR